MSSAGANSLSSARLQDGLRQDFETLVPSSSMYALATTMVLGTRLPPYQETRSTWFVSRAVHSISSHIVSRSILCRGRPQTCPHFSQNPEGFIEGSSEGFKEGFTEGFTKGFTEGFLEGGTCIRFVHYKRPPTLSSAGLHDLSTSFSTSGLSLDGENHGLWKSDCPNIKRQKGETAE